MSNSYDDVMARRSDIMRRALALDYDSFQHGDLIFDYDALMSSTGYSLDDVARIQAETKVGDTRCTSCTVSPKPSVRSPALERAPGFSSRTRLLMRRAASKLVVPP